MAALQAVVGEKPVEVALDLPGRDLPTDSAVDRTDTASSRRFLGVCLERMPWRCSSWA
jgi:hypothetical protein